jgi:hypothetical protein
MLFEGLLSHRQLMHRYQQMNLMERVSNLLASFVGQATGTPILHLPVGRVLRVFLNILANYPRETCVTPSLLQMARYWQHKCFAIAEPLMSYQTMEAKQIAWLTQFVACINAYLTRICGEPEGIIVTLRRKRGRLLVSLPISEAVAIRLHIPMHQSIGYRVNLNYPLALLWHPVCALCKTTQAKKKCGACIVISYCGRECQKKHWPLHKKFCHRMG